MKSISTFLRSLIKTFTSPVYYKDILAAPFSFSLKFFLFYFFLYSIVVTTVVSMRVLLPLNTYVQAVVPEAAKIFPSNLEIKIKDGQASTNVTEPYYIPMESVTNLKNKLNKKVLAAQSDKPRYLLVIDTKATINDFPRYQTALLLTKDSVIYSIDGKAESVSLQEVKSDVVINTQLIDKVKTTLVPMINSLLYFLIFAVFIFSFIFIPMFKFYYLLFFALILFILAKLFSYSLSYKKSLQIGLHLGVVSTTVFSILPLLKIRLTFPFLQTIFLIVLSVVILQTLKTNTAVKVTK